MILKTVADGKYDELLDGLTDLMKKVPNDTDWPQELKDFYNNLKFNISTMDLTRIESLNIDDATYDFFKSRDILTMHALSKYFKGKHNIKNASLEYADIRILMALVERYPSGVEVAALCGCEFKLINISASESISMEETYVNAVAIISNCGASKLYASYIKLIRSKRTNKTYLWISAQVQIGYRIQCLLW